MITNFEKETEKLTDKEIKIVPYLVKGLQSKTAENPIKAPAIVKAMNEFLKDQNINIKMTEPMLRKCIGHIRRENILPIIGTSKGYFVSYDKTKIMEQIKSLNERAESMIATAKALKGFI